MAFQIILVDKNPELIEAWENAFAGLAGISVRGGNLLLARADALVSPANSFGFMDGGFDWNISELFQWKIQVIVQRVIRTKHKGELLVGAAEVVATGHERFPYLAGAPTMRVPQNVADTVNAFLAMRAILMSMDQFNTEHGNLIQSVAIPGLGTGIGKLPYERCARQMRAAYDLFYGETNNNYRELSQAMDDDKKYRQ